ncbi:DUF5105 domain-containing protein [Enterococcus nangangensis]|uniref:DUF5105 domain-containing protein n=1 Tax=Enterococcus nangangensis TaxID=2559926 RepID=UPI0010F7FA5C|nr:DUF5105 domain-containing protein [Enterococcus nangangensis]
MKKIVVVCGLLVTIFFALSACGAKEPIAIEDAATLFANRLVYQKESEEFETNFKDSASLKKVMDKNADDFKTNFLAGLTDADEKITEAQAAELSNLLLEQMQTKTSYAVEVKAENEETALVVYHVSGLDFPAIVKKTDEALIAAVEKDNSIAKDDAKILATILASLKTNLAAATVVPEQTNVAVTFTKAEGQWQIASAQATNVANLYLAFASGAMNQEELTQQLQQATDEVNAALTEKLQ